MNFQTSRTRAEGYQLVAGYLGIAAMLIGCVILLPLLFLIAYPEETPYAVDFIAPGAASVTIGYLLYFFIRGKTRARLRGHQDSVAIISAWILAILVSSLPFMLTGRYGFAQAVFEATSGFTATGLSIVDVEKCPRIFLAFRSIMLFCGGVGFVLVMTSILSDRGGMRLYTAGEHGDRRGPPLLKSAKTILALYAGYAVSGTLLYLVFGMGWFDALNHSMAAVATGGFSTRAGAIGFYDSFPIEIVTMVLMALGSTSYLVHLLLVKGKFGAWMRHGETKFSLVLVALTTPLIGVLLAGGIASSLPEAFRTALFQVVSALTTTGLRTTRDFASWPSSSISILIVLTLIGGGAGSMAGGIKQTRAIIVLKSIVWDLRDKFNHKRIIGDDTIHHFGLKDAVTDRDKSQAGLFVIVYLAIFALGTLAYSFYGYSLRDSAFEFAAALGSVGFSAGISGPSAPAGALWIGIAGMFLGRFEIYVVFMGFARIVKDAADALRGR